MHDIEKLKILFAVSYPLFGLLSILIYHRVDPPERTIRGYEDRLGWYALWLFFWPVFGGGLGLCFGIVYGCQHLQMAYNWVIFRTLGIGDAAPGRLFRFGWNIYRLSEIRDAGPEVLHRWFLHPEHWRDYDPVPDQNNGKRLTAAEWLALGIDPADVRIYDEDKHDPSNFTVYFRWATDLLKFAAILKRVAKSDLTISEWIAENTQPVPETATITLKVEAP